VVVLYISMLMLFTQIKRNQIRKGMVMVDPSLNPTACWEFEGDILVLHHPTTISTKYQAMGENGLNFFTKIVTLLLLLFWQSTVVALGRLLQSSQWTKTTFELGTRPHVAFVSSRILSLSIPVPAWCSEKAGLKQ
jgi:hypothetical protein